MAFTIRRTNDLSSNERMVAFYKKELQSSQTIQYAKKQKHYNTKWYRKNVSRDVPSSRRYLRMRAIVSSMFKKNQKKYDLLVQLGKLA